MSKYGRILAICLALVIGTLASAFLVPVEPVHAQAVDNFVWVTNHDSDTVSKIDKTTTSVVATIPVGDGPFGVAVDPEFVWVANQLSNTVSKISKATSSVVATIPVNVTGFQPGLTPAIAVDVGSVWVVSRSFSGDSSGRISKIDKSMGSVVATIDLGGNFVAVDESFVWVTRHSAGTVLKIDKATASVVATVPLGTGPNGIKVDDSNVWVAMKNDQLAKIDKSTNSVTMITLSGLLAHVAVDENAVWVTGVCCEGTPIIAGFVYRVNRFTAILEANVSLDNAGGVSVDTDFVWVANFRDLNMLSKISKSTNLVVATIPVGQHPIMAGDGTGFAYDFFFGSPNNPPVLAAIGNKMVDEETLLTFTTTATDPDAGQTLTFSLVAAPAPAVFPTGATIGPTTGVFTWTPTEAQGPGTYSVIVRVTDNGTPALSDEETITITVNEVNVAPVLTVPGAQTVNELVALTFTVSCADSDIPANTLTLSASGLPTGATFDAVTGTFSWAPTEAQGPGSFTVPFTCTDNGIPSMFDIESVAITVNEVNVAPVLAAIGAKTVAEQTLLTFTATATDSDIPAQTLIFTLGATPTGMFPADATMTSAGVFTWTPTEAQGPGTYTARVTVSDGSLTDFEDITLTVNEVNGAPILDSIGNKTVVREAPLSFVATALDSDLPRQDLVFSIGPAPTGTFPTGAVMTSDGNFLWTPSGSQSLGTYVVRVSVSDRMDSDSQDVSIIVTENLLLDVEICVDGSDFLYLRGGIMWVVHRNYELPGCIIVRIYDSFGNLVNSTSWTPKWYTDQSRRTLYDPSPARCGQTGCLNFATEIFSFSSVVSVDPTSFQALMSRNVLNIFQPPSDLNGFTTVVLFDDDPIGGLASYEFKISYVPFNIFTIDLKLCEDGDDSFYFRSGVMWIVHGNNELPGWHSDCSSQEITVKVFNSNGQPVKSIAWLPNWYTDQSRSTPHSPSVNGCGETGCSGFTSSELVIFPTVIRISPWSFNAVTFRYNASLFQSPSQNNNFTTIVHLDDNPPGGATLYEFKVSYTSQENPPPLLSPVGGDTVLVDKLSLLAPYMGLASVVVAAAVATVYLKRTKRREETQ